MKEYFAKLTSTFISKFLESNKGVKLLLGNNINIEINDNDIDKKKIKEDIIIDQIENEEENPNNINNKNNINNNENNINNEDNINNEENNKFPSLRPKKNKLIGKNKLNFCINAKNIYLGNENNYNQIDKENQK